MAQRTDDAGASVPAAGMGDTDAGTGGAPAPGAGGGAPAGAGGEGEGAALPSFTLKVRPCEHSDTAAAVVPAGLSTTLAGQDPPLIEQLRPLSDAELR